jgi:hypothetical protein
MSTSVIAAAPRHLVAPSVVDAPPRRPSGPMLIGPSSAVVALRRADVVPLGRSVTPRSLPEGRLVAARDSEGTSWWIPADAVWADAATNMQPERLRPCGLATGASTAQAMVLGISDRLGRDAVNRLDAGDDLPVLDNPDGWKSAVVLDGRLGSDIPTVVVVSENGVRWGAGTTWQLAFTRALFGKSPAEHSAAELAELQQRLATDGLFVVGVDIGSDLLTRAGITRLSVQVVTPHDGLGR